MTHAFHERTGKHFAVMSWATFLKAMNAKPETVREAEEAETSLEWIFGLTEVEMHIIKTTVLIRLIIDNYLATAVSEDKEPPSAPPYIHDREFDTLVRHFQHAILAYEALSPNLELINSHFHQMVPILGVALGTNDELKEAHSCASITIQCKNHSRRELLSHCNRFLALHDQLIKYLEDRLGREIVQRFFHPL